MSENRIERLQAVLRYLGAAYSAVAIKSGISPSNLKNMLEGKQTITDKTMHRIQDAYPEFNIDWLKYGEGDMLNPKRESTYYPERTDADLVPLLPIDAMAGNMQGFSEGVELAACRKIESPVQGAEWAIQISGDSMEPEYKNGSYLYIKKMTGSFIPWGNAMIIDTYDGVVFKEIYPDKDEPDCIKAKSINPKYPTFQIEKSSIIGLYRVLGVMVFNSTI